MRLFVVFLIFIGVLFASVDINNASVNQLESLRGVGSKKAKAIVFYRASHGCFINVDELSNIKGIGHKTIENNRANLVVGKCRK